MVAGKIARLLDQDYVWQIVSSFVTCSDPTIRIELDIRINIPGCQGMILCDRHVCYYHECRDLLENRFRLMTYFHDFHV